MTTTPWLESDRPEGGYDRDLLRWVLRYARPHWRALASCVALLLALAGLDLAQPWIISQAIDQVLAPASEGRLPRAVAEARLWPYVAAYLLAVVGAAVLQYVQLLWLRITGQRIITQIRTDAFGHLEILSLSFFDRNPTGRIVTRLTNDVEALNEVYTSVLVNLFRDVFFMAGAALLLLRLDWRLALVSFAVLPFVALTAFVFRRHSRAAWRAMRSRLAYINATLSEAFSGMRVTQLFAREEKSAAEFAAINDDFFQSALRLIQVFAVFRPALDLLTAVALAGIIWFGGGQALAGVITVGTLYAFTAYTRRLYQPLNALAEKFNILQSALASAERIHAFLATPPDVVDPPEPFQPPTDARRLRSTAAPAAGHGPDGHDPDAAPAPLPAPASAPTSIPIPAPAPAPAVQFDGVWFAYAGEDWVLRDVSFTVQPGETVAFVGHTGAGKSTIMNLLPRFYDVQRGAVRVHGVDVRRWRRRDLRRRVGTVMQDVFLFAGDIADNIALGEPAISRGAVEQAATAVGADPFIRRLPDGYDEPVMERGQTLSTGQRQLISFARALAFDPEVLILDEATASVDSETEAALQAATRAAARGRTTLVVAHRLSTVQDADRIYVLDHGRIVEVGNHDALLAAGGLYRTLWQLQFRVAEADSDAVAAPVSRRQV